MKPAPTKNNTAKLSKNKRIVTWQEEKYNERQKALVGYICSFLLNIASFGVQRG